MTFIGRAQELALLNELFRSGKGELFVLYGRRRVGKSELLAHFCLDKPAVFFTASQAEAKDNLEEFTAIIQQKRNDAHLQGWTFQNIEAALAFLARGSERNLPEERLVVVLDEFPYWVAGDKAIPSLIQRFWDNIGRKSNLMLILCGSSISMMVEHTLAERAPLYGRRTAQLELKPFDYQTSGKFFPHWSDKDKVRAYGVLGGIPAYLEQFDPNWTFSQNIKKRILQKGTFLNEEANFLLKTELRDTKTYRSILKAIASGNTTLKDLTSKMGMDARAIASYLANLQSLNLVQREASLSESAPEKNRKGRYFIQDNFLNFWFLFVEPNMTVLDVHQGSELFDKVIEPNLNTYLGKIFESICRQFIMLYGPGSGLPISRRLGRIWDKDFDIDVVSESTDGTFTFAECKWSSAPVDAGVAHQLKQRAAKTGLVSKNSRYVLFSASGFKGKAERDTTLIDLETMFQATSEV
jgi:AAA+ ATPase superfamily predicted ATPase